MNEATPDERESNIVSNLSHDRAFSSKNSLAGKHKTVPVGHSNHVTHNSLSSSTEMTAD
jgi:hypothetical protein